MKSTTSKWIILGISAAMMALTLLPTGTSFARGGSSDGGGFSRDSGGGGFRESGSSDRSTEHGFHSISHAGRSSSSTHFGGSSIRHGGSSRPYLHSESSSSLSRSEGVSPSRQSSSSSSRHYRVSPDNTSVQSSTRNATGGRSITTASNSFRGLDPARSIRSGGSGSGFSHTDFSGIGRNWRDHAQRWDRHWDRHWSAWCSNHSSIYFSIWFPGFTFGYYCCDYSPGCCYPSPFCYYYDYCPPYVYSYRVIYEPPTVCYYHVVTLPIILDGADDYYLVKGYQSDLRDTLNDISQAWESRDVEKFMDRVSQDDNVAVYIKDEYAYSLSWQDYHDMTRDAMKSIKTRSFDIYSTKQRDNGDVVAYAKHVYTDREGKEKSVYVSYTLHKSNGEWFITEAGASSDRYN